jgi:hypothetical protein
MKRFPSIPFRSEKDIYIGINAGFIRMSFPLQLMSFPLQFNDSRWSKARGYMVVTLIKLHPAWSKFGLGTLGTKEDEATGP